MPKQITKKQHYAPKFYLRRFADGNSLQTLHLKSGKIIKPQPYSGVCYADFYYAVETGKEDEASQEFEDFFRSIEDRFSKDYDSIIDAIWTYKQLSPQQLGILAWFLASLWIRSPQTRKRLNDMMEDGMKWYTGIVASHPDFKENAKKKLIEDGKEVTDEALEDVMKTFQSGEFQLDFDNQSHLHFITKCEEFYRWLLAKNWRFYLAKGSKRFVTSDTPVIDIFTGETMQERMYGNHIMARQQFLALTPEILIELTDPTVGKKVKRQVVGDTEVVQYNLMRAQHSEDYCYAQSKSDLEDLKTYYLG